LNTTPLGDGKTAVSTATMVSFLGALKGPIVKIAQMVGMIPGLLPNDCAQALLTLCTTAPAMHPSLLRRKMQLEWGKDWQTRFAHFDQKAIAAASLGQIHRAELHDGTLVAVKVQYPSMKQAIQGDLALFKMLLHRWASNNALDMQDFPNEWEQRLHEELDYTCEINHMACWRALFKDDPLIHIPLPFPDLTTEQILTMSWSAAQGIQTAFHENQDLRNDLGKKIFWAWYYPFYHGGMLHGDPHMGNMAWFCPPPSAVTETDLNKKQFYEQNAQIHIFDFGCVRIFPPMFVQGFCHLYQGLLNADPELTQQAYTKMGFKDLTPAIIMALNDWAHFLLAPFLQDQECLLEDVSCPKKALDAMKQLEHTLKAYGRTKIPPEFLIFDRVAVILGAVLMRLQVNANWYRLMAPLIQSFCLKKCRTDQKRLLEICKKNDILY
jgi:predicted unusual protein kinase regulating ubiquinone biosynthesis (AarF/ABC1/UbiB family)